MSKTPPKIKKQFAKGFFWGKIEHKLESYTTLFLLVGLLFHLAGIISRKWILVIVAVGFFLISLVFRVCAGISHKLEKHFMDSLRFGKWKKKK